MKLTDFWENDVPKDWKHFLEYMSEDKINYIKNNINNLFLKYIDFSGLKNTLDWGCGEGLVSNEFSKFTNIILIDISNESLNRAKNFIEKFIYSQLVTNNIDDFVYAGPKPDIITSHAVIHHFPSYLYWKKVLNIWAKMSPVYIAIHLKVGEKTKEVSNYYENNNFLNGLILNEKDVVNDLYTVGYELINNMIIKTLLQKQKISGFFVFKKLLEVNK